jgi:hypothetical protein
MLASVTATRVDGSAIGSALFADSRPRDGVQGEGEESILVSVLDGHEDAAYVVPGLPYLQLGDSETWVPIGADLPFALTGTPRQLRIRIAAGEVLAAALVLPPADVTEVAGNPQASGLLIASAGIFGAGIGVHQARGSLEAAGATAGEPTVQSVYPQASGSLLASGAAAAVVIPVHQASGSLAAIGAVAGNATVFVPATVTHYMHGNSTISTTAPAANGWIVAIPDNYGSAVYARWGTSGTWTHVGSFANSAGIFTVSKAMPAVPAGCNQLQLSVNNSTAFATYAAGSNFTAGATPTIYVEMENWDDWELWKSCCDVRNDGTTRLVF